SSMAQDEVGHALAYYTLLQELGEGEPDQLAFMRNAESYRCCQLVEQPIGDYAFSIVRHYLYDQAEDIRLSALTHSTYRPLAELAKKLQREEKYHLLHARTWVQQLAKGTEESRARIQSAIKETLPMAFSIFEPTNFTEILAAEGICPLEQTLQASWFERIQSELASWGILINEPENVTSWLGGRKGWHSIHLQPLLDEMSEVFRLDPQAAW
ncbi:MAG: phenylacetate-CoA oxygenase subunit PaaC, partial [Bacteroidia bacterium]|nr:phenylacetate-CoA oxygenase subunit PaaC [Bacteroidia bacterium]